MEKEQILYRRVDDYFHKIFNLKKQDIFIDFLKFQKRCRRMSAFNNALVFIQDPKCYFYETEDTWMKKYNRKIKNESKPNVILMPYAPVEFVYDVLDTVPINGNKDKILEHKDIYYWWEENEDVINQMKHIDFRELRNITINNLVKRFDLSEEKLNKYNTDIDSFGYAQKISDKLTLVLHPRYKSVNNIVEEYGVLCHEIAHLLLGHLDDIKFNKKSKDKIKVKNGKLELPKDIYVNARYINKNVKEIEAEFVAYMVFTKLGLIKNSDAYIGMWLRDDIDIESMSFPQCFKVANEIANLSEVKSLFVDEDLHKDDQSLLFDSI